MHPNHTPNYNAMIEYAGFIAIILGCGLFADSLLTKQKVKNLTERINDLEKAMRER